MKTMKPMMSERAGRLDEFEDAHVDRLAADGLDDARA